MVEFFDGTCIPKCAFWTMKRTYYLGMHTERFAINGYMDESSVEALFGTHDLNFDRIHKAARNNTFQDSFVRERLADILLIIAPHLMINQSVYIEQADGNYDDANTGRVHAGLITGYVSIDRPDGHIGRSVVAVMNKSRDALWVSDAITKAKGD